MSVRVELGRKDDGDVDGYFILKMDRGDVTSSSGCSATLAPSSTLGREREADGFLRRMDPREESVMLWI